MLSLESPHDFEPWSNDCPTLCRTCGLWLEWHDPGFVPGENVTITVVGPRRKLRVVR